MTESLDPREAEDAPAPPALVRRAREWLEDMRGAYAPLTVKSYLEEATRMAAIARELGLQPDIRWWGEEEVHALVDYMRVYAAKTLAKRVSVLDRILSHAGNPIVTRMRQRRRLRLPPPERGFVRWHSRQQQDAMLKASSGTSRVVMALGYGLGLRRFEMANLGLEDVTDTSVRVLGKGGGTVVLPLRMWVGREVRHYLEVVRPALVARARLRGYRGKEPRELLVYAKGPRLSGYSPEGIRYIVERVGELAGVPATTHDLRRSFGRRLYEAEVDPVRIKKLLRHRDMATTIAYLGLDQEDMIEALDAMYADTSTEEDLSSLQSP